MQFQSKNINLKPLVQAEKEYIEQFSFRFKNNSSPLGYSLLESDEKNNYYRKNTVEEEILTKEFTLDDDKSY